MSIKGEKKLTFKDIAAELGISTATVSRVMAGNTAISEERRARSGV